MPTCLIALGSNLGDRRAMLEQQRNLEHCELGAALLLLAQEINLGVHHHWVHDAFELPQLLR